MVCYCAGFHDCLMRISLGKDLGLDFAALQLKLFDWNKRGAEQCQYGCLLNGTGKRRTGRNDRETEK